MGLCIWSLHRMTETMRTQGQHGATGIIPSSPLTRALTWPGGRLNFLAYNSSFSFWKKKNYISHDFRLKLPFEDNVYEGAFSEHTIEHLYYNESKFLLSEICRVLKKSSIFRCTVPGLEFYIENYKEKKKDEYFSNFETGCDALRDLTNNWGHLCVWDGATLKREMLKAGFSSVKICKFGEGENRELIKDLKDRVHQTIYLEAKK